MDWAEGGVGAPHRRWRRLPLPSHPPLSPPGTDIHAAGFAPLFNPAATPESKAATKEKLATKLAYAQAEIGSKAYLSGDAAPSVADLYLYVMLGWCGYVGVDLSPFEGLLAFQKRIAALPKVAEAHAAMNAAA